MTTATASRALLSSAEVNAAFGRLREFDRGIAAKTNKHDRVHLLIHACISEGMNTKPRIVGALKRLGCTPGHVSSVLNEGLQLNPEWPYWGHDAKGIYYAPEKLLPTA